MWMQDQRSVDATEEEPSVAHTFRHVYRFILRAMQGDTDAASAIFQRYLAGELPEELLALSRRCVQEDQMRRRTQPCDPLKAVVRQRPPVRARTSPAPSSEVCS